MARVQAAISPRAIHVKMLPEAVQKGLKKLSGGSSDGSTALVHLLGEVSGSINATVIGDGVITSAKIASNAVTTAKILDGAVTTAKIDDGAVTTVKIADGAVTSDKILDGTITNGDISDTAGIHYEKLLLTGSIVDTDLAADSVTFLKIAAGAVLDSTMGMRTVDDSTAPTTDTGFLTFVLGWLANRIKAILGGSLGWKDAPPITLTTTAAHVANTSNPHSVTATQVGKSTAQWNADKIQGHVVSSSTPSNGQILKYNSAGAGTWDLASDGGGVLIRVDGADVEQAVQVGFTSTGYITWTFTDPGDGTTDLTPVWNVPINSLLYANTNVTSNTVANTTTATAFASSYTIPANDLVAGDVIRIKLWGIIGAHTGSPTIQVTLKFGSTTIVTSGTITLASSMANTFGWFLEASVAVFSDGISGTLDAQGLVRIDNPTSTGPQVNLVNTSTIAIDTTTTQAVTATAQWSAANANNTITLRQMIVEILRATA